MLNVFILFDISYVARGHACHLFVGSLFERLVEHVLSLFFGEF